MCGGGWSAGAELRAAFYFISSFPFLLAFDVGGLGYEFCVFVAGWRHAPGVSGQCMEQWSCGCSQLWHSAPPGMAVGCSELRLRSTPWYRLVCICFPTHGRGLPYGSGLGLSRCLGPGECLHSFIHSSE